eukprot:438148-Hanusia_phi.AAC.2
MGRRRGHTRWGPPRRGSRCGPQPDRLVSLPCISRSESAANHSSTVGSGTDCAAGPGPGPVSASIKTPAGRFTAWQTQSQAAAAHWQT